MAIDLEDEIVQDFLVEAGEILETLNEQAVDLETSPDDEDLLNAVFRGFHTIKGGGGFLALDNLVHVAHKCEDIFDLLRQGERKIDADLMDVVLNVLDILNDMFDEIRSGEDPTAAPADLMNKLNILADKNGVLDSASVAPAAEATAPSAEATPSEDITEQEFDELVDALSGKEEKQVTKIEAKEGDITEEEFEALLDELHGSGGAPTESTEAAPVEKPITKTEAKEGDITEEEFDQLLDELHGKGKPGDSAAVDKTIEQKPQKEPEASKEPEAKVEPVIEKAPTPEPVEKETEAKPKPKAKAPPPTAESTVRVETSTLDSIMNLVGELVLIRNRMSNLEETIGDEEMTKTAASLDVITSDLQTVVLKTRMQPIKKIFGKFPRVVRDLARSLGREINLEMHGEETDLDKNLVEALADPLVHLVRNAVDHGIEMPDVRESNGKKREGTLMLGAKQEGDHVLITISDDGAGMDPEVLRAKAVEKGMMDVDAAARLDDRECYELIFSAGFSTKVEISDVSGRGVGMDVVKTRISQLNGIVEIDSKFGEGTTLTIKLPLTLAIMPTLMVILGEQIFALPLVSVKEIMDFHMDETNVVDGQNVLVVRGRALPIFNLSNWLVNSAVFGEESKDPGHVVIVNVGTQQVGLLVDDLIGQEEVVIKPLGSNLQGTQGLAGATITGDGRIALILDLPSLIGHYASRYS
ncbi:MAG: chemotaxis protein CheW [Gammaproteobacteria bacterium]